MIMTRTLSVNVAPTVAARTAETGVRSPTSPSRVLSARSRPTCTPAAIMPNPGLRRGSQYRDQGAASLRDQRADSSSVGNRDNISAFKVDPRDCR